MEAGDTAAQEQVSRSITLVIHRSQSQLPAARPLTTRSIPPGEVVVEAVLKASVTAGP